nr:deoxycytidylate deaminase-like protein [Cedratvirus borely]
MCSHISCGSLSIPEASLLALVLAHLNPLKAAKFYRIQMESKACLGSSPEEKACFQPPPPSGKRKNYLSWDDFFMSLAFLSAQRSKDPRTQVGACVVKRKKIRGMGYNGFPWGCPDDLLPWAHRSEVDSVLDCKTPYVCHAEMNAILNSQGKIKGSKIYVVLFPCNECAKLIIQSKVKEVIYFSDKYAERDEYKASRRMLQMAKIKCRQHIPKADKIVIEFAL